MKTERHKLKSAPGCVKKYLRMGFEPMPVPTRNVLGHWTWMSSIGKNFAFFLRNS